MLLPPLYHRFCLWQRDVQPLAVLHAFRAPCPCRRNGQAAGQKLQSWVRQLGFCQLGGALKHLVPPQVGLVGPESPGSPRPGTRRHVD